MPLVPPLIFLFSYTIFDNNNVIGWYHPWYMFYTYTWAISWTTSTKSTGKFHASDGFAMIPWLWWHLSSIPSHPHGTITSGGIKTTCSTYFIFISLVYFLHLNKSYNNIYNSAKKFHFYVCFSWILELFLRHPV